MKDFFGKNTKPVSSHVIGKADKKKFNAIVPNALDIKQEYRIVHLNNKTKVIKQEHIPLYFQYHNQVFPTIRNFRKDVFRSVFLDAGVLVPLARGADIMAPGILKFIDTCPEFTSGEPLGIEVEGKGVCAVGIAVMSFGEMKKVGEGPVINILHVMGDALDQGVI
ncbi:hypothetical protein PAEPH01_1145 [Pancytospora epiphaga]|nr:hypothetical protein PAEPH01_1145 [Pancytospora epiphaga]